MDYNNGNLIFWLICLGLLVGGTAKIFFGDKGRTTAANVLGGAFSALLTGFIGEAFGIGGSIAFGVMGATAFLILFNVFCLVNDTPHSLRDHPEMDKA